MTEMLMDDALTTYLVGVLKDQYGEYNKGIKSLLAIGAGSGAEAVLQYLRNSPEKAVELLGWHIERDYTQEPRDHVLMDSSGKDVAYVIHAYLP